MHELSITQSLLEIALRHAEQADARRITRLNLVIGELASIVDDSVQFYWDIVSRDTIATGAELHFERIPGSLRCLGCGHTFPLNYDNRDYTCPACGERQVMIAGGDDFRLESIEVE
jgi:hydrogenase nickel incorporation protein HypA/HybF